MKTILLSCFSLGLLLTMVFPAAWADEDPPKAAPAKQVPSPGRFEMEVTSGDSVKSFTHPSKALPEIARALSRDKRAKEGEESEFEAVLTLNDQVFTFNDPEAALEACKALSMALRDLPKLKMGLGDLGEIPEVKPEDQPPPAKSQAAAMMEVRRRIQVALQKQQSGGGGRVGRPQMPNPAAIQKTINQELEKARQEGLLPNPAAGYGGGDLREAKKEAIVQSLAFALSGADSTRKAEETEDKPTEAVEK